MAVGAFCFIIGADVSRGLLAPEIQLGHALTLLESQSPPRILWIPRDSGSVSSGFQDWPSKGVLLLQLLLARHNTRTAAVSQVNASSKHLVSTCSVLAAGRLTYTPR